jgi:hypothetical protein
VDTAATAIVLIDSRLHAQLDSQVSQYVQKASDARGFKIDLRVLDGLDD